jgi:hypothetical protein
MYTILLNQRTITLYTSGLGLSDPMEGMHGIATFPPAKKYPSGQPGGEWKIGQREQAANGEWVGMGAGMGQWGGEWKMGWHGSGAANGEWVGMGAGMGQWVGKWKMGRRGSGAANGKWVGVGAERQMENGSAWERSGKWGMGRHGSGNGSVGWGAGEWSAGAANGSAWEREWVIGAANMLWFGRRAGIRRC